MGFPNARQLHQHLQSITTETILQNAAGTVTAVGAGRLWGITFRFNGANAGVITATIRDGAVADGSGTTIATIPSGTAGAAGQGYVVQIPLNGLQFSRGCTVALAAAHTSGANVTDGGVDLMWEKLS